MGFMSVICLKIDQLPTILKNPARLIENIEKGIDFSNKKSITHFPEGFSVRRMFHADDVRVFRFGQNRMEDIEDFDFEEFAQNPDNYLSRKVQTLNSVQNHLNMAMNITFEHLAETLATQVKSSFSHPTVNDIKTAANKMKAFSLLKKKYQNDIIFLTQRKLKEGIFDE